MCQAGSPELIFPISLVPIFGLSFCSVTFWLTCVYSSLDCFEAAGVNGEKLMEVDHKFLSSLGVSAFKDR